MGDRGIIYVVRTGLVVLCTVGMVFTALGAPPPRRGTSGLGVVAETSRTLGPTGHAAFQRPAFRGGAQASHLDLRPPTTIFGSTSVDKDTAFVAMHRQAPGAEQPDRFSQLGGDLPQRRIMGRPEEIVNRFRHEGLPVARLWENHAALVSLGLNQRGKPGLWIIQKTR
jgi:hypothetical protein